MPTSAEAEKHRQHSDVLVDTSVAVALSVEDHEHHEVVVAALAGRRLGLSGHAVFETFSVLTRLPAPQRRPPRVITELIEANFPATRFLSAEGSALLFQRLGEGTIAGGAIYDALVAGAAAENGLPLATLDRRALNTYRFVGVEIEFVETPETSAEKLPEGKG